MFSVSQDFAPPFKLISPFFIAGSLFYLFSTIFIFFISPDELMVLDTHILGFVHFFALGFVMMIIFGAMAQLVPVVLEVGHFGVELFYAIWPLLGIGTVMMAMGFIYYPTLLPFGGTVVLIAMTIFIAEIFLTIKKVQKLDLVMSSVLVSNIFLLLGVIYGLMMALGYAGMISVDIDSMLRGHVFLVVVGYIVVTVMGLSVVLLPMFGLSHGFSKSPLRNAMIIVSLSVVLVALSSFVDFLYLEYIGYALAALGLVVYFGFIRTIYKTRARKEIDIYAKSLIFSYFSMLFAIVLSLAYLATGYEPLLLGGGWVLFFGFFGFIITGHMYKIVPFLVWFDRFSPLVGKQKVPMLADMLPPNSSSAQFVFGAAGVVIVTVAILLQNDILIKAGASFMLMSALAFLRSVFYMINYK